MSHYSPWTPELDTFRIDEADRSLAASVGVFLTDGFQNMDVAVLLERIAGFDGDMRAWRHDIHRHPELAYEEHRTAKKVAELLRSFGVDEVTEEIGETGVVGVIRNGDGPMVGLRADMDALPIEELADRAYRSQHQGKMHACGHDGHTAMALGAARYLAETRDFQGSVALIFQPAEEGAAGARAMIEDGLWDRFPIREVYGMHNIPSIPAGTMAVSGGPVMAAADRFSVVLQGKGGHAAAPHLCRDPIVAGAALVSAVQTLVSRNCNPSETLVISITEFHGGDAFNVIPDSVRLNGTVRYFRPDVGEMAQERLRTVIDSICAAYQVQADYRYRTGYPPTVNWDEQAALARGAAEAVFGGENVIAQPPLMFAEDFSYFLIDRPGCYGFIGNGDRSGDIGCTGLHNPHYDFNDSVLVRGAAFLAQTAQDALRRLTEHG